MKHAAARRLRYCPVEVMSMEEFLKRWPEHAMQRVADNVEDHESCESEIEIDEVSEVADVHVDVDNELLSYDVEASTEDAFGANSLEFVKLGSTKEAKNAFHEAGNDESAAEKRSAQPLESKKKKLKKTKLKI